MNAFITRDPRVELDYVKDARTYLKEKGIVSIVQQQSNLKDLKQASVVILLVQSTVTTNHIHEDSFCEMNIAVECGIPIVLMYYSKTVGSFQIYDIHDRYDYDIDNPFTYGRFRFGSNITQDAIRTMYARQEVKQEKSLKGDAWRQEDADEWDYQALAALNSVEESSAEKKPEPSVLDGYDKRMFLLSM